MGWEKMKFCLTLLAWWCSILWSTEGDESNGCATAFFLISRFVFFYTVVRFNLPYSSCYCGEICNCVTPILQVCETIINIFRIFFIFRISNTKWSAKLFIGKNLVIIQWSVFSATSYCFSSNLTFLCCL